MTAEQQAVVAGGSRPCCLPGGALGAAQYDDDVISGIWSDGDERRVLRALGSETFVSLS